MGGSSQFNIQPNMQGILVMCTRARENRAVKEAIDLFNQVRKLLGLFGLPLTDRICSTPINCIPMTLLKTIMMNPKISKHPLPKN